MAVAGVSLMLLGLLFFLGTVLGVHRFPDCYTRMHGAAKGDTLSSMLFVGGILLASFHHLDLAYAVRAAKLCFIIAFLFIASPAASHALVAAAFARGIKPWQGVSSEQNEEKSE